MTEMGGTQLPNIDLPNKEDPQRWAKLLGVQIKWFRFFASQSDFAEEDIRKCISGLVASSIEGDDELGFGSPGEKFDANSIKVKNMKDSVIERLETERDQPETHGKIKECIKNVLNSELSTLDFTNEDEFKKAKIIWTEKLYNPVKNMLDEKSPEYDKDLKDDVDFYKYTNEAEISVPWVEFLNSH